MSKLDAAAESAVDKVVAELVVLSNDPSEGPESVDVGAFFWMVEGWVHAPVYTIFVQVRDLCSKRCKYDSKKGECGPPFEDTCK